MTASPAHFSGILVLDKPAGITSARALDRVKRVLPRGTKVGHAGTLDPFATGVLLVLIGRATKLCEFLMGQPKGYDATVKLGATTATLDPESPEQPMPPVLQIDDAAVRSTLDKLTGNVLQRPPIFSAIKLGGRRAYDLARKGQDVQIEPRTVQIYSNQLLRYDWPLVDLRITCGRGTYIRSIARDLGEMLGTGGYLVALRRTHVGSHDVASAIRFDQLTDVEQLQRQLIPLSS